MPESSTEDQGASSQTGTARHVPVMTERVVELLEPVAASAVATVVDATVGLGGHSQALLDRFPRLRVVGLDRDPAALQHSSERLSAYADRLVLVHAVYDALPRVLSDAGIAQVDGVLFDLGVSSLQLDEDARGFSYSRETPLDMRMDPTTGRSAADVVNTATVDELARLLARYGEERFARRIAAAIVRDRANSPITSSARLAALVRDAVPAATRRHGGNPAKRTFQALRIEVNDELGALRRALPAAISALRVGGRIVVLAYHSLEDRIVKQTLAEAASASVPPDLPVVPPQAAPQLRLLTRGAERPTDTEVAANPRAASARLRAAERVREAA